MRAGVRVLCCFEDPEINHTPAVITAIHDGIRSLRLDGDKWILVKHYTATKAVVINSWSHLLIPIGSYCNLLDAENDQD